jgi:general stress protein YciG
MLDKETRELLSEYGRKGGLITGAQNLKKGSAYFSMLGKKSAEKRNKKKLEDAKKMIAIDNEAV